MTDPRAAGSRVPTVFLGSGGFGLPTLRVLADHPEVELVGVVTAPVRPAGRGGRPASTPIAIESERSGVGPVLTPERLREPASIEAVRSLGPELLVLADYGRLVPPALLELPHGALNLHPSLLPRHRGASPIPATILAGDPDTGATLIRMDAGVDTGPILARERLSLAGDEVTSTLEMRLAALAADLLAGHLAAWLAGDLVAVPQPEAGATMTRPLRREDGRLDPSRSAIALERQVRAYQPWPGAFLETVAGRLLVLEAAVEAPAEGARPGILDARGVGVGDGERLVLRTVRPAGGRSMPYAAFLRGRPVVAGSRVRDGDATPAAAR